MCVCDSQQLKCLGLFPTPTKKHIMCPSRKQFSIFLCQSRCSLLAMVSDSQPTLQLFLSGMTHPEGQGDGDEGTRGRGGGRQSRPPAVCTLIKVTLKRTRCSECANRTSPVVCLMELSAVSLPTSGSSIFQQVLRVHLKRGGEGGEG